MCCLKNGRIIEVLKQVLCMKLMKRVLKKRWSLPFLFLLSSSFLVLSCSGNITTEEVAKPLSEEERELEYRKTTAQEAVIKTKKKFEDSSKNYNAIQEKIKSAEEDLNKVHAKQKFLESALEKAEQERINIEKEVAALDAKIAGKKVGYPELWEAKRSTNAEMQAAKREYENEKSAVSEKLEAVTATLESTKNLFELFPSEVEQVSEETYISHGREFLLYIFGLKILWGVFTGYRPTFVYPDEYKMAKVLEKYRSVMVKSLDVLAQVEHLNFAKILKEHFNRVHTSLADAIVLIERGPKNLIALKKRVANAKYKLKLKKQSGEVEEGNDAKSPEMLEFTSASNQLSEYLSNLRASAQNLTDAIVNLIQQYSTNEIAPIKRANYEEYRELFLKADAAEKAHNEEESVLKAHYEKKKNQVEAMKLNNKRISSELREIKKEVSEVQERYNSLVPQHEHARQELQKSEEEYRLAQEEQREYS